MRPDLVSWRPSALPSAASSPGRDPAALWSRYLTVGGALLALGLLIGFYWVVSSLVQRAENGRERARVAFERLAVCSAFSNASSRELCAAVVASHVPANAVLRPSYEQPAWTARKRELTASLH